MASPRGCTGSARLNHHHQIAAAAIHAAERIPAQPAAIDLADPSAEAGTADQTRLLQQLPQDINLQGHGLHLTLAAAQVGARSMSSRSRGKGADPEECAGTRSNAPSMRPRPFRRSGGARRTDAAAHYLTSLRQRPTRRLPPALPPTR